MKLNVIGNNIRKARKKKGFTQSQLADRIQVSWEMISRYERGVSSPINRIDRIATALDTSITELLQEYDNSSTFLHESDRLQIPLFVAPPENMKFISDASHNDPGEKIISAHGYYYSAPAWLAEYIPGVFAIIPDILDIRVPQIRDTGPIFVKVFSANSDLEQYLKQNPQLVCLAWHKKHLIVEDCSVINEQSEFTPVGIVLGQDAKII